MILNKYKNKTKLSGVWYINTVEKYLTETVYPLRFSYIAPNNFPVVVSLWFVYEDKRLWCAVQKESAVARNLKENSRCAFEIGPNEPPYMGIRGQGKAVLIPEKGEEKLKKLVNRYLDDSNKTLAKWLLSRSENEVAICIELICIYSWDYRNRMK
jgi:nitroimidazol reductase NimA-like FMN-containing flavoprotein (pyridoxamine 5'-phosphate oxidase superfamily)